MKWLLFLLNFLTFSAFAQSEFNRYFTEGSMRVDFMMAGNAQTTRIYLHSLEKEQFWGGSVRNLVDTLNYGTFLFTLSEPETGNVIFSRGFCTLYDEWQTTPEAKITHRSFFQTVTFPFPKDKVKFQLYERGRNGYLSNVFSVIIQPDDIFIGTKTSGSYEVTEILRSGDPSKNVDIVFIPEGYTKKDMNKFVNDVKRLCDTLFNVNPFKTYKNRFNISAVMSPSAEQGTDIPGEGIWKNTIVNSTFYTFNTDRYLSVPDYWKLRDIAAAVPYDQICVLVNTDMYGGGGIFNHYNISTSDNRFSSEVFIHEFGHGFGGLGDEYYTSEVTYENFYPLDIEPWEPNLTTLVDFEKKWKDMVPPGTPVPTPDSDQYKNNPGAFEGGGYMAKGIYRPQSDCRMLSLKEKSFCKVCVNSFDKMIRWISD